MRAVRWAAALCWLTCVASCAVSVPQLGYDSGGGGPGGSAGGTGSGGAVDCTATNDCSTEPSCACVPSAGSNFLGPVLFAAMGTSAKCPAGFATQPLKDPFTHLTAAPPAKCNKCECDTPCGSLTITAYTNETCSNPPLATAPQMPGGCQGSFSVPISSVMVSDAQVTAMTCTPSGGGVMTLPPTSHDVATLCIGDVGAGCGSGDVCVPAARGSFEVCVYAEGAHVKCPSGFPNPTTIYTGTNEQRRCSDCTCGDAASSCPTTFEAFSMDGCMTGSLGHGVAGTCFSAPAMNGHSIEAHVKTPCTPGGGDPKGEVELTGPYTVCCR